MPTAESQKATPPLPRIAFAAGTAALFAAFLLGAFQSVRSQHRMPSTNLLVDGPAEYIEDLMVRGEYGEAVRQLALYEPMSSDRLPHERLAVVLSRLDAGGRRQFAQALRDHPGYARGHFELGTAFLGADEYDEARAELETALRLQPHYAEAHNALGVVLAYQGHGEEAVKQFWQALRLNPGYEEARINLEKVAPMVDGGTPPTP